jgi:hypothetical protein
VTFPVLVHNWVATAFGGSIGDGAEDYSDSDTDLVQLEPDLFWRLDDEGSPSEVEDLGSANYVNSVSGAWTFELAGPFSGTGARADDPGATITAQDVDMTEHTLLIVANVANRDEDDTVIVQYANDALTVTLTDAGWVANGADAVPYIDNKAQILLRVSGGSVSVYTTASAEPHDTVSGPTATGALSILGENIVHDNVVVIDNDRVSIEDLIALLAPPDTYDQTAGLTPTEVTPAPGSNILSQAAPANTLAPSAWHIRDDGFGMFFVNGHPDKMYTTEDYGNTWTGPIDKSAQLEPPDPVAEPSFVGCLMYDSGTYVLAAGWESNRDSSVFSSSDDGVTWTRRFSTYYGWGVDISGGTILTSSRSSDSGGVGFTRRITLSGDSDTVHTTSGTTNGYGAVFSGDGSVALSLYQDSSDSVTASSPFGSGTWSDINPNPEFTQCWKYATIAGDASIWGVTQKFTGGQPSTMPLTQTDHLESSQSNFRTGSAGYQASSGKLIRTFSFTDTDNSNRSKIHMELNDTGGLNDWGDKFHINLPENHNHSIDGDRSRIMGAGPFWFYSYVGDLGSAVRLLRFSFPPQEDVTFPPAPAPTTGETLCIVNAESPSGLVIGNDAPGQDDDVYAAISSNVSTASPKFGSRHLYIQRQSPYEDRIPFTQPYWQGMAGLEIGDQDFTMEGWWRPLSGSNFGYFGSSQAYARQGGRWWRWGGLKMSLSMNQYFGRMSVYVGHDLATALSLQDNNIYTGNAKAMNLRFNLFYPELYNHVAMCRRDGVWYYWMNGRPGITDQEPQDAYIYASGEPWRFGAYLYPYNGGASLACYSQPCRIDSYRFVLGEALYTRSFTPPQSAFTA